jgi:sugar phosphate permease
MLRAESDVSLSRPRKFHYAIIVAIAGFLTQVVLLCCQRLPALSLEMIRETLQINYSEVGLITSWYTVFYAGAAFVWGWMTDRVGAKASMTAASAIASLGMILFGTLGSASYVAALVIWSVAGFGCAGLYMATIPKLIAKWFAPSRRGFAMALVTPGGTVCSIVLGLVVPTLIVTTSWQTGFLVVGGACVLITLSVLLLVKEDPSKKGLAPFGAPKGTQAAPAPALVAADKTEGGKGDEEGKGETGEKKSKDSLVAVVKMPITWHFGLVFALYQLSYMTFVVYYVAAIIFAGYDTVQAGLGITFGGVCGVIVQQVYGFMSDRMQRKIVIALGCAVSAVCSGLYAFFLGIEPSLFACYLFTAFITGFVGLSPALLTAAGDCYPSRYRGSGPGVISTISIVGRYLGPWVAGMIVDATGGNIAMAFAFAAAPLAVTAVIAMTLPKVDESVRV